ncbi:BufA1 family periplasmic bufferin-type metallophore [Sphingobium psychrophilum]|jgi:uncharacterized membrane protein
MTKPGQEPTAEVRSQGTEIAAREECFGVALKGQNDCMAGPGTTRRHIDH